MQPISMVRRPYLAQLVWLRPGDLLASAALSCPLVESAARNPSVDLYIALLVIFSCSPADFLAGLSPLETLRRYLNDRAMRRQLKDREPLEQQRLRLENMKLANEVMLGRLEIARIARSMDIPDQSIAAAMGSMDSLVGPDPDERGLPPDGDHDLPPSATEQDGTESGNEGAS